MKRFNWKKDWENTSVIFIRLIQCLKTNWDALRDLVPFVNLKREKHPWRSVTFRACNFTRSNIPSWVFFMFFKLHEWYQIKEIILIGPNIWDNAL